MVTGHHGRGFAAAGDLSGELAVRVTWWNEASRRMSPCALLYVVNRWDLLRTPKAAEPVSVPLTVPEVVDEREPVGATVG